MTDNTATTENAAAPEITMTEIVKDIQTLGNVVQQHDMSVFQIIASLNALQSILIDKELCTEEELTKATEREAGVLQEKIIQAASASPEDTAEEKVDAAA